MSGCWNDYFLCCISSDGFDIICISPIQLLMLSISFISCSLIQSHNSLSFPMNDLVVSNM